MNITQKEYEDLQSELLLLGASIIENSSIALKLERINDIVDGVKPKQFYPFFSSKTRKEKLLLVINNQKRVIAIHERLSGVMGYEGEDLPNLKKQLHQLNELYSNFK